MISRTYVDSSYLLAIIFGDRYKSLAENMLSKMSGHGFEIIIPQTVLGEMLAKILERGDTRRMTGLPEKLESTIRKYNINMRTCLPPLGRDALRIANDLMHGDTWLDVTDIMITSQVLSDPHAKFFLTFDKKLLGNARIEYEEICAVMV